MASNKALHAAFGDGKVSLADYGLCLVSGALGLRPSQIASLQIGDLKATSGPDGKAYVLSVPRAKQGGGTYRGEFTDRPLVEEIGMAIEAQCGLVRGRARAAGMENPEQAPLFPAMHKNSTFYGDGSMPAPPTPGTISDRIRFVMEGLEVKSERTGGVVNVNPTRARRTVGTRAALAGGSLAEIAAALDHTSLRAAMVYVEIRSGLLERLDKKMAMLLAPLAQRFAGKLVSRGHDAEQGTARHVFGATREGGGPEDIGGCGKHGFCGLGKPIACYTCRLFQPWVDGPHEAILEWLLRRREALARDSLIVASALDDSIVACAEVVRQCAGAAEMLENARDG